MNSKIHEYVAHAKFTARLVVDGQEYDCSAFMLNFAINTIPSATVLLPVGRNALRPNLRAKLHDTAAGLRSFVPAQLYLRASGRWSPNDSADGNLRERWTAAGEQLIFEGYLTSWAYTRRNGQVRPVMQLTHWLSDLSFSSCISNQTHPSNPTNLQWYASFAGGDTTLQKQQFVQSYANASIFLPGAIAKDFWGESLFRLFSDFAKFDALAGSGPANSQNARGIGNIGNAELQQALARMERRKTGKTELGDYTTGAGSPWYVPLSISLLDAGNSIALAIGTECTRELIHTFLSNTVWDKLVGQYASKYFFALVPRVKTAIVAPFIPGLRQTFDQMLGQPQKALSVGELLVLDTHTALHRPLRGVSILAAAVPSQTDGSAVGAAFVSQGGEFVPDPKKKGLLIYRPAPSWLSNAPIYSSQPERTGHRAEQNNVFAQNQQPQLINPVAQAKAATRPFYELLAKTVYANEMLRSRHGLAHGKLRFDIAPGTTVRIVNEDPLFLPSDQLSQDLVATVTRVTIRLDVEQPGATGTAFQLDHIRSAEENKSDTTSIAEHPLYSQAYVGAPLVDELLFAD